MQVYTSFMDDLFIKEPGYLEKMTETVIGIQSDRGRFAKIEESIIRQALFSSILDWEKMVQNELYFIKSSS